LTAPSSAEDPEGSPIGRGGGRRPAARTTGCAGFDCPVISRIHRSGRLPTKKLPLILAIPHSICGTIPEPSTGIILGCFQMFMGWLPSHMREHLFTNLNATYIYNIYKSTYTTCYEKSESHERDGGTGGCTTRALRSLSRSLSASSFALMTTSQNARKPSTLSRSPRSPERTLGLDLDPDREPRTSSPSLHPRRDSGRGCEPLSIAARQCRQIGDSS